MTESIQIGEYFFSVLATGTNDLTSFIKLTFAGGVILWRTCVSVTNWCNSSGSWTIRSWQNLRLHLCILDTFRHSTVMLRLIPLETKRKRDTCEIVISRSNFDKTRTKFIPFKWLARFHHINYTVAVLFASVFRPPCKDRRLRGSPVIIHLIIFI